MLLTSGLLLKQLYARGRKKMPSVTGRRWAQNPYFNLLLLVVKLMAQKTTDSLNNTSFIFSKFQWAVP